MPVVQLALFCKLNPEKAVLQKDYRKSLMYSLISGMLSQRLNELRENSLIRQSWCPGKLCSNDA